MKKADPQAVQRGRLFRAALFVRFSVWFRFTACACIGERSEPTCIIQAHAVVPFFKNARFSIDEFVIIWYNSTNRRVCEFFMIKLKKVTLEKVGLHFLRNMI